jgi:hypothetical protein
VKPYGFSVAESGLFFQGDMPSYGNYDVVVCGGGTAGIAAAIAAAENDARTLLIEKDGFLGGTANIGVYLFGLFDSLGARIAGGIPRRICHEMVELGGAVADVPHFRFGHFTAFEPWAMKLAADRMVAQSGADLLLHTYLIDIERDGSRIQRAVIQNKQGRFAVEGKSFVDATGDGDVLVFARGPFEVGRKSDGMTQAPTLIFRLSGFNKGLFLEYLRRHPGEVRRHPIEVLDQEIFAFCGLNDFVQRMNREESLGLPREFICFHTQPDPTDVMVVATRVSSFNGLHARSLTYGEIETRRQAAELARLLKRYVPGFGDVRLITFHHRMGIRETRRLVGEYILTEDDLMCARQFPDGIAKGGFPIDIHSPDGKGNVFEPLKKGYQIPYRSLVTRQIDNLWIAGRCISTSHVAQGSTRVIATCMATGQAAGTAAAIGARKGLSSCEIGVGELRDVLNHQGAIVD